MEMPNDNPDYADLLDQMPASPEEIRRIKYCDVCKSQHEYFLPIPGGSVAARQPVPAWPAEVPDAVPENGSSAWLERLEQFFLRSLLFFLFLALQFQLVE